MCARRTRARTLLELGNTGSSKTFFRSSAKIFQAMVLVESGAADRFAFTDKELALCCSSHDGEADHTDTAVAMLHKAGLEERHLLCGAHAPYSAKAKQLAVQQGTTFSAKHNNCSGKHAGMLAACVHNGWPLETYQQFDHPLQVEIRLQAACYPPRRLGRARRHRQRNSWQLALEGQHRTKLTLR